MSFSKRIRPRHRLAVLASLAIAVLLFWSSESTAKPQHPKGDKHDVTVMTQNLYLGAALDGILTAGNFFEVLVEVGQVWDAVNDTDFPDRARRIAQQIIDADADLVGLQEAALWRIQSPGDILVGGSEPATTVVYDFVAILLAELSARGADYQVVVSQDEMDAELPSITGDDIRFTDRDVILARKAKGKGDNSGKLKILGTSGGRFDTLLQLPVGGLGGPILTVNRGWVSADVQAHGRRFRFVNTHLEDAFALIQEAQAVELLAGPFHTELPIVALGDFNSDAYGEGTNSYEILLGGGFDDAWLAVHDSDPGLTWGQDADLRNPTSNVTERLDLVLLRGKFHVHEIYLVGDQPADRTPNGLWPSDHAGIAADLEMNGKR